MSLNGKYSLGIVLTFALLAMTMLYIFPFLNSLFETKTLTAEKFFYSRVALWFVLIITFLYSFLIEKILSFYGKRENIPFYFT
jgi:hypothetical protein